MNLPTWAIVLGGGVVVAVAMSVTVKATGLHSPVAALDVFHVLPSTQLALKIHEINRRATKGASSMYY